jgi:hypothetical protein
VLKVFAAVILAFTMFQATLPSLFAESASGVVAYVGTGCDYFIVQTNGGDYALLEWYGGAMPSVRDRVVGNFESYGFVDIVNLTSGQTTHVWVDDYWLSRDSVVEKYTEQCGRPPLRQSPSSSQSNAPSVPSAPSSGIIQSNLRGEFNGWDGETVFLLDNGQVWQQASYAYHYHYAYRPRVTIVATSRGHVMQVEGVSETILVRQIR